MTRLCAWAAALALLCPAVARAGEDAPPRARAQAAFDEAERASKGLHFAEALARYREAASVDPGYSLSGVARARATDLEAHAEGGFEPLVELERMRRDPARLGQRAELERLAERAESFPAGRVRGEAWLLAGEELVRRFDDRDAERVLKKVVEDPAADELTRGLALSDLVAYERQHGSPLAALALLDRYPSPLPGLHEEVARTVRRARLELLSFASLGALGLAALVAFARAAKRDGVAALGTKLVRPWPIAIALYLGGGAAVVASLRADGDPKPFVVLGGALAGLVIVARALSLGAGSSRVARALGAAACAVGALAAAFLAIAETNASYLASFGL